MLKDVQMTMPEIQIIENEEGIPKRTFGFFELFFLFDCMKTKVGRQNVRYLRSSADNSLFSQKVFNRFQYPAFQLHTPSIIHITMFGAFAELHDANAVLFLLCGSWQYARIGFEIAGTERK